MSSVESDAVENGEVTDIDHGLVTVDTVPWFLMAKNTEAKIFLALMPYKFTWFGWFG